MSTDVSSDFAVLARGVSEIISPDALKEKLKQSKNTGRPLRVKAGFDPTATDLHLGHTVLFQKMRAFQELGHEVIFLMGDFTGMIGDPSGRSETRPALTREQVLKNAETYKDQIFKILNPQKTKIRFNSEWMGKMSAEGLIALASQYTVARILERDDFTKRYQQSLPISIHEFLYPLIQGYDSVMLQADIELGGTDQKFNLLVGRELQKMAGQPPQVVMTLPLLEGTDGVKKMSKTFQNAIAIFEPASGMFGKVMSIPDTIMYRYYELLTDEPLDAIRSMHPMEAKRKLASIIIERFHGESAAKGAEDQFDITVGKKRGEAEELFVSPGTVLIDLLCQKAWAKSRSDARRLIIQGGVEINGRKATDNEVLDLPPENPTADLKVGKKIRRLLKRGVQDP
ncbi:MAG: tyrosine--tRNA ligase [Nitrospirota bacterium]